MKSELQNKLYEKYPKLFTQKSWSTRDSCMPFGIETGNGWYNIIDNACRIIQWHITQSRKERAMALAHNRRLQKAIDGNTKDLERFYDKLYTDKTQIAERVQEEVERKNFRKVKETIPQIQFTQIKEKFGTLRMYTNGYDDYIDGVVALAEMMSSVTCEVCGVPGRQTSGGWVRTLCVRCAKQSGEKLYSEEEGDDE